jgi:hypothetical protein
MTIKKPKKMILKIIFVIIPSIFLILYGSILNMLTSCITIVTAFILISNANSPTEALEKFTILAVLS